MPNVEYWDSFYDAPAIVSRLVPECQEGAIVEFGTGYGTFTIPTAERISGNLMGFDIESELVKNLRDRCKQIGLTNVTLLVRDFCEEGSGLDDASADHVLLYNILHIEEAPLLLAQTHRILKPGSTVSIIHWRGDIETPRGPTLAIRPTVENCIEMALKVGFINPKVVDISDVAPYHFGLLVTK